MNFKPRSRIFSIPQSFTSGRVSSLSAIAGRGKFLCLASGPPRTSHINLRPVRPSSILSMYSLSSSSRSSSIKRAARSRLTTSALPSKTFTIELSLLRKICFVPARPSRKSALPPPFAPITSHASPAFICQLREAILVSFVS